MMQRKAVVTYILNEVLELDTETSTKLVDEHKYNTVLKLSRISERTLTNLCDNGVITDNDADMLNMFAQWYSGVRSRGTLLPGTLEQWKETLTANNVDEYSFGEIKNTRSIK